MSRDNIAKAIKQEYPDINWDRFEDIDRAVNWELWHGPLPSNYWKDVVDEDGDTLYAVEPLEHYEWKGFIQADKDIRELLDPLPYEMWWDGDAEYLTDNNPEDDEYNWGCWCKNCDEFIRKEDGKLVNMAWEDKCPESEDGHDEDWNRGGEWIGSESWSKINLRQELMFVESWKQVF